MRQPADGAGQQPLGLRADSSRQVMRADYALERLSGWALKQCQMNRGAGTE